MAQVTVDNPVRMESKKVDSSGKLYLGRDIAGHEVKFIIEEVGEEPVADDA